MEVCCCLHLCSVLFFLHLRWFLLSYTSSFPPPFSTSPAVSSKTHFHSSHLCNLHLYFYLVPLLCVSCNICPRKELIMMATFSFPFARFSRVIFPKHAGSLSLYAVLNSTIHTHASEGEDTVSTSKRNTGTALSPPALWRSAACSTATISVQTLD